jgi:hypothetical protein
MHAMDLATADRVLFEGKYVSILHLTSRQYEKYAAENEVCSLLY